MKNKNKRLIMASRKNTSKRSNGTRRTGATRKQDNRDAIKTQENV